MVPRADADPLLLAVLDDGMAADPRFLADARLLIALHRELPARLGDADAARAMLQAGFVQGLRDATRAAGSGARRGDGVLASPLVPMRFVHRGGALRGAWPSSLEAEAVLVARGRAPGPACLLSAGYTSGWVSGLWDADFVAVERSCAAHGASACGFEARDAAAWEASGDPAARALVAALPFAALRAAVSRGARPGAGARPDPGEAEGAFDPESPAVHVWGPVMVVPYAGDETAVAVDAVVQEPSAACVTVVVVDLRGAAVDDGFGAVALERVFEAIESHGAEAVLVGLSPLSERVVADLHRAPVVVHKDLRTAIAAAFQIAESQRRAL